MLANFPTVTLDAMASSTNTVCPTFYSKYESLNSMGIDFFSQSLDSSEFFFVFPPVSLALSTLQFLESQKVQGIFIIPIWPLSFSSFWSLPHSLYSFSVCCIRIIFILLKI